MSFAVYSCSNPKEGKQMIRKVSLQSFTLVEVEEVVKVVGLGKEAVVMDGGQAF